MGQLSIPNKRDRLATMVAIICCSSCRVCSFFSSSWGQDDSCLAGEDSFQADELDQQAKAV